MVKKLLVASRNKDKLEEIRAVWNLPGVALVSPDNLPGLPNDIEEDASTFEGNALKKAHVLAQASGLWTLADDSGLEVAALHGAPGVLSARYAGVHGDSCANNAKLLHEMKGIANRRARFRCVLALVAPDGREWLVDGRCEGRIADAPDGRAGFGYDPLFIPDGHEVSFARMEPKLKNAVSHRGLALRLAADKWAQILA